MSTVPAAGVPVAQGVAVPEVLITAESQSAAPRPDGVEVHLENVDAEADAIQAAYGGEANAEVQGNISVSDFVRLIAGRTTWCFPGHGDAMLQSEPTLAFVGEGDAIEVVSIDTLVGIVRPHVLTGKLKLIVLTGCCTARLAAALRERAFVPYVVCWETVLNDEAGRIFGTAFAQAIADGAEPPAAFDKARTEVCTVTEPGKLDTGLDALVPKFELDINPKDVNLVHPIPLPGQPQTVYDGRIRRPPGAPRGPLAAGTPKLLRFESTTLHGVPSLPAHYMPRPEQWDLRDALVNGVRGDGTVVGIVGASPVTGIAGTAGLGKTTTANWLALDPCVRSAFRDGVFWLEFGKERTAMQRLVRLAERLEVPQEDLDRLERRGMDSLHDEVARRLKDRCCLIVLDDVWDMQQPKPFRQLAGGRVTVLMTTRKSSIVAAFGERLARLELRPMEGEAATRLMVQSSGKAVDELHRPSLAKLVKMCAGLPAMLRSVGRMCNTRSAEGAVKWFADHKRCHEIPIHQTLVADGYQLEAAEGNLFLAYEGQLDGLAERDEELVTRCTMLAVFPEDTEVPLEILSDLWGTDMAKTRGIVERLAGEHLVELVADGERIRLLDPVRDYLRCRGKSALEGWHAHLLGACRARQVGGYGGNGYWEGRENGGLHFMHHLNGCNGKLGDGSLGAIRRLFFLTSSADAIELAAILKRTKIVDLNLFGSKLGPKGVAALANGLKGSSMLKRLDNTQLCGIDRKGQGTYTTDGIIKLCMWLKGSALISLNLSVNRLGSEGGAALAKALKHNTTLQELRLADNKLCGIRRGEGTYTTEGITKLCEALKGSAVTSLDIRGNSIRGEGASALAAILKETQITTLNLAQNELCGLDYRGMGTYNAEGIIKLCEGLVGSVLTSLNVGNNELGPHEGAVIAEGLKGNSTLQSLNLLYNSLGEGADAILYIVSEMPQIVTICGIQPEETDIEISGWMPMRAFNAVDAKLLAFDLSRNQTVRTVKVRDVLDDHAKQVLTDAAGSRVKIESF